MARPLVPDTTELIAAIRNPRSTLLDSIVRGQVWLSSVVLCELYAGTRSPPEQLLLQRLLRGASRAQRLIVPTVDDWVQAGSIIARRVRLDGPLRPRDHLADVLIVVSAARIGGEVISANRRHFEVWVEMARRSGRDVVLARGSY